MSNRAPRLAGVCAPSGAESEVTPLERSAQAFQTFTGTQRDVCLVHAAAMFAQIAGDTRLAARLRNIGERLAQSAAGILETLGHHFTLVDAGHLFRAVAEMDRDPDTGYPREDRAELQLLARRLASFAAGVAVHDVTFAGATVPLASIVIAAPWISGHSSRELSDELLHGGYCPPMQAAADATGAP